MYHMITCFFSFQTILSLALYFLLNFWDKIFYFSVTSSEHHVISFTQLVLSFYLLAIPEYDH